jgi:putative colanic acid biosynthesis UDP-glucose lipid carrier transferase
MRSYNSKINIICRLLDSLLVAGGLLFSSWIHDYPWNPHFNFLAVVSVILFYFIAKQNGLYASWRMSSIRQESLVITKSWIMMIFFFIAFLVKFNGPYLLRVVISWFFTSLFTLILWRVIMRSALRIIRRKGRNTKTVVIGGAGELGLQLANVIFTNTGMGFKLNGFYDDYKPRGPVWISDTEFKILGNLDLLVEHAKSHHIDLIYLALPMRAEIRIKEILKKLADMTASVHIVPDMFTYGFLNSRLVDMDGIPTISIYEGPFYGISYWVKQTQDFIIASMITFLMLPVFIAIAIGVKLSSPGPVIFKQRRYGFNGEEIIVWKYRTMTVCEDGPEIPQAMKNDPRITRFGEFLRSKSLDELPQFINVLQGRMSIVGPRPHAVAHNEHYRKLIPGYMLRHIVKPGITGWAQINGWRGETDTLEKMQKRLEYDLDYIRNWSLWLDLRIIFKTLWVGFGGKNAH